MKTSNKLGQLYWPTFSEAAKSDEIAPTSSKSDRIYELRSVPYDISLKGFLCFSSVSSLLDPTRDTCADYWFGLEQPRFSCFS